MCGSMADIQSAAVEIRRGKKRKKKKKEEERTNHSMKIYMVSLFHRATIKKPQDKNIMSASATQGGNNYRENVDDDSARIA